MILLFLSAKVAINGELTKNNKKKYHDLAIFYLESYCVE